MHGQHLKGLNASANCGCSSFNKKSTHNWLKRGKPTIEKEAFITAAQDQHLRIHDYEKTILKVPQDDVCRDVCPICQSQSETVDHFLIFDCPILEKNDKISQNLPLELMDYPRSLTTAFQPVYNSSRSIHSSPRSKQSSMTKMCQPTNRISS